MRPARPVAGALRQPLPVALCALGGHLVLYRSLLPTTGDHAYFSWYAPLVAGTTVVSLAALALLVLAALLDRGPWRAAARMLLPTAGGAPATTRAVRLALASAAFLVVQESCERSLSEGRLAVGAFSPSQILLLLVALGGLAALVALVERSCLQLIERLASAPSLARRAPALLLPVSRPAPLRRRRNPLAEMRGLRAPPLAV